MPRIALPTNEEVPLYTGDSEQMNEDLRTVARNGLADKITGGLSHPSKMPCPAFGIPASRCRIGSVLAQQEGTTCSSCYAMKGNYSWPNVQRKQEERYQGLFNPLWTPAMVHLIGYFTDRYFRWFDAGDVQGVNHLKNIIRIAEELPDVQFWMPTREKDTVQAVGPLPSNLVARMSATRVDGPPPRGWPQTSVVYSEEPPEGAFACVAQDQQGKCGRCRACWSPDVPVIAYPLK